MQALVVAYRRSPEFAELKPSTQRHYNRNLRRLEDAWHLPLAHVTRDLLLDMRDAIASGYGPSAANSFVQCTSAVYAWATKRRKLDYNPLARAERLKEGSFPTWTLEQIERALDRFPESMRRVLILGMYIGQRRSDLIKLTWADYDGEAITLRQEKTGVDMTIPLTPDLRQELDRWKAEHAPVVPHPTMPILLTTGGRPWTGNYLSTCFTEEVRKAGLPDGLNVHGLRKFTATNLAEHGLSVYQIQSFTGHRNVRSLTPYVEKARQSVLADSVMRHLAFSGSRRKMENGSD